MIKAYSEMWKRYIDFSGVTDRKDFWFAYLVNFIILLLLALISSAVTTGMGDDVSAIALGLYGMAVIIPFIAMMVRRLRDSGRGWGFVFFSLVPVLAIVLIIFLAMPSVAQNNVHTTADLEKRNPDAKKSRKIFTIVIVCVVGFFVISSVVFFVQYFVKERQRMENSGLINWTSGDMRFEISKDWEESSDSGYDIYTNGGRNTIMIDESLITEDQNRKEIAHEIGADVLESHPDAEVTYEEDSDPTYYYQLGYWDDDIYVVDTISVTINGDKYYEISFVQYDEDESITFDDYGALIDSIRYRES